MDHQENNSTSLFRYYTPFQKMAIFLLGVLAFTAICCLALVVTNQAAGNASPASLPQPARLANPSATANIPAAQPTNTPNRTPTPPPSQTSTANLPATLKPAGNTFPCIPPQTAQVAEVAEVVDGDTIKVWLDGQLQGLRYIGVDTPETSFGTEPFGPEAADLNSRLVLGKQALLYRDVSEVDRYGRLLRYVVVDGVFINDELVRGGYAEAKDYPPDTACAALFHRTQAAAQTAKAGMWAAGFMALPVATKPTGNQPTNGGTNNASTVIITAVDKRAEVVTIRNNGSTAVNLAGWVLVSEKGNQACALGGTLAAGQSLAIWAQSGAGYSCNFGDPIWNNSQSDPAALYNAAGQLVSRK